MLYPAHLSSDPLCPRASDFEVRVKDETVGKGVFTCRPWHKGEVLARMSGTVVDQIRQHTLQISPTKHNYDPYFSGYFLHSCEPNISLDMETMLVTALKDIPANSWLYMDYAETEDYLFKTFPCGCNATSCRGWVTGRLQLPSVVQEPTEQSRYAADASSHDGLGWRLMMSEANALTWWQRPDLAYENGRLQLANQDVRTMAIRFGSPSFVYSAARIKDNLQRIHDALNNAGLEHHRIHYAMKANRFAPLLTMLKQSQLCGIDACSPNEVIHAVSCGFEPEDISFTAGSLSERDFAVLAQYDGICMDCDSLHAIDRWGQLKPKTEIGIRINPALGIGRGNNEKLLYAGEKTSKFGIYREQFEEALALADRHGLRVTKIHFHTGCGYLTEQLPLLDKILDASHWFIEAAGGIERVNIGGGLGVPHTATDVGLDLDAWAHVLAKHYLDEGLYLEVEPGDYIVKDAGLLILGKTYIETKRNTLFLGTDAGFNISPEPAYYQLPFQPVPLQWHHEALMPHHVTGHINEALDIWAEGALLPDMTDQDYLALINAGAYAASMASNHCMRGEFKEFILL